MVRTRRINPIEVTRPPESESVDDANTRPLSHAEQGVWYLWRLDPGNPYYTGQGRIIIDAQLDDQTIRRAWLRTIERHQSLRAGFALDKDGVPYKFIREPFDQVSDITDLSGWPESSQREFIEKRARSMRERAYDLEQDRLFEFRLYRCSASHFEILISFHEIVLDNAGVEILLNEFVSFCCVVSDISDKIVIIPGGLPTGPKDRPTMEAAQAFWKDQLSNSLPSLNLPIDRRRPAALDYRSASEILSLDTDVTQALRVLSENERIPLSSLLISAVQLLLGRYAGQNDVVIGIPVDNRPADRRTSLGFFINMLPLRARISGHDSFRSFLRANGVTVQAAMAHADFPFDAMVEMARSERDLSIPSLFQATFAMAGRLPSRAAPNGGQISYVPIDIGFIKHDLAVRAHDDGKSISLEFGYLKQLFDPSTVRRMLANLATLLGSIAADPDRPPAELDYIAPAERDRLLFEFNDTRTQFGTPRSIRQLFEDRARRTPSAKAVQFGDASLSYEQLNERADKVARYLSKLGIRHGDRVGLCIDRSLDTLVGLLGVIKTGATYVPLDPQHPAPRLMEIVGDCKPAALLLHKHRDGFDGYAGVKVYIDAHWDRISVESGPRPLEPSAMLSTLAIIYTSATTGKPKGVLISESAVLNRLQWMWNAYPFQPGDVALIQKSSALVASTWELFGGLLQGVPSVILSYEELLDPARLWHICSSLGVTHFLATPALIEGVLLQAERRPGGWPTLRFATTSAEPISTGMVRRWKNAFPGVPLFNLYGATECASNATVFDTRDVQANDSRVAIGRPLANVQAYVLDERGNLLPQGAIGELCIAGECLAEGYLNRQDLNNERFLPNPFPGESGRRLYRTGDLVRLRADENLEFIGRRDNQVNIRGFRVELNDIEAVIETHAAVKQAAVILAKRPDGSSFLSGFVSPASNADRLQVPELRAFVEARLPAYMIPANFAVIDRIPLTRQGKIDRKALHERCAEETEPRQYAAPETRTEARLARVWERLLGVPRIGLHDNFFDLGGHSLLAVRLFAEIGHTFGKDLPLSTLYHARTLQHLARVISDIDAETSWSTVIPVTPRQGTDAPVLFCVHGIFGDVLFYQNLSDELGTAQPLYGLQPPTLTGKTMEPTSLHELAASYVNAIRMVQPNGPYHIAGFSYGARVALEMAQILRHQGDRPELLVSFDGSVGERLDPKILHRENIGALCERVGPDWMRKFVATLRSSYIIWRCYMAGRSLGEAGLRIMFRMYFLFDRVLPRRLRSKYTEQALRDISNGYRPSPYDGRTVVFCTPLRREYLVQSWRKITGTSTRFIDIAGRHNEIFNTGNLQRIALVLTEELGEHAPGRRPNVHR